MLSFFGLSSSSSEQDGSKNSSEVCTSVTIAVPDGGQVGFPKWALFGPSSVVVSDGDTMGMLTIVALGASDMTCAPS